MWKGIPGNVALACTELSKRTSATALPIPVETGHSHLPHTLLALRPGPASSFLVISPDPQAAKHVLRATDNPARPVREGPGGGGLPLPLRRRVCHLWRRRLARAAPCRQPLPTQGLPVGHAGRVFGPSAQHMTQKREVGVGGLGVCGVEELLRPSPHPAAPTSPCMPRASPALTSRHHTHSLLSSRRRRAPAPSWTCGGLLLPAHPGRHRQGGVQLRLRGADAQPLIQAVYTSLKETESRATDLVPIWKLPLAASWCPPAPRGGRREADPGHHGAADRAVQAHRGRGGGAGAGDGGRRGCAPVKGDPSVLRLLIASREEVTSTQV